MADKPIIMVVEDHPELGEQLRELLEQQGFEVHLASDGRSAKNIISKVKPNLICTDLVLSEGSGYEVCDYVRASSELGSTPILMMTGKSLPTDRAFAEEAGANVVMIKPFDTKEFLRNARELLGRNVIVGKPEGL
ncbi:MAG: response regulator transcription factor [Myxococcaceae bacterium]